MHRVAVCAARAHPAERHPLEALGVAGVGPGLLDGVAEPADALAQLHVERLRSQIEVGLGSVALRVHTVR